MDPNRWKQVDNLLQRVLERPVEEHEEFLRRACDGDPALQEEVRSLLASHQKAGSFLESPAAEAPRKVLATEPSLMDAPAPSLRLGAMVAHYRLTGKLGEGAMGEVYRARDTKLGRDVALKILPQAMAHDAERMARFEREAQVLASLNHPNIAAIHGLEESSGVRALVMELVEGETLAERIVGECSALPRERGALPYEEVLPIARQITEALEYAHEHGIIHRDLKPANVKITPEGTVKVLDFGLAKVLNPQDTPGPLDPANSPTLTTLATKAGMILGTATYMSPEQAKGQNVDRRCDIWAFGCVLYEMLSGRKAFDGETISDVLAAVLTKEPDWNALPATTPLSIQRLIRRCLQKDLRQRLQAIGEARIAIEETLTSLPSPAARLPQAVGGREGRGRVRASARRHTVLWALAGICTVAVLLVYWLVQRVPQNSAPGLFRRGPPQATHVPEIRSIAVLPLDNLSGNPGQEYFAEGMTDELITELSNIGALRVIARTSVMRYSGTKKPLTEIARELNVDALIEGSVLRSGNRVRINARLVDGSTERVLWEQTFERDLGDILALSSGAARSIAERIRITVTPEEQRRLASSRPVNPEAYEALLKGRFFLNKRTQHGFHQAITYFEQALEQDPTYAAPYVGLADTYNLLGGYNYLPPDETFPKAKAAAQKALSINETSGEAHTSLGLAGFEYDWDWPLADGEFRRGIELNSKYANGHLWYSYFLSGMGRHKEAMAEIRRAQRIDPLNLVITMEAGSVDYFDGRFDPAVQEIRKALEMDSNFWRAHWLLGLAYMQKGTADESILELEKASALSGNNLRAVGALGQAYAKAGRKADALKALDELKDRSKRGLGGSYFVASIYVALQENTQALRWLQRAYLQRDRWLVFAKVDPSMSPLRSDPRFQALLRRMNLPK